jgi:endonuclease-3
MKSGGKKIEWELIFAALEKWREELADNNADTTDPSVNTVAENYRHDPWAVLASTILSLRTKDEVTLCASKRLLEKACSPAELLKIKEKTIEELIYPVGFYRNKAASLKKIAAILLEKYKGNVPSQMEQLLALPGVGRKTANLVLNEAFDISAICVDIHVHRISNRCGWLSSKTPEETEMILRDILPEKFWKRINYLLVLYGQKVCRPVSPFCSRCVIHKYCNRAGVVRSR